MAKKKTSKKTGPGSGTGRGPTKTTAKRSDRGGSGGGKGRPSGGKSRAGSKAGGAKAGKKPGKGAKSPSQLRRAARRAADRAGVSVGRELDAALESPIETGPEGGGHASAASGLDEGPGLGLVESHASEARGIQALPDAPNFAANFRESNRDKARAFAILAARSLSDDKCEEVQVLEVAGLSQVYDYVVLASGTSDRQMRSAGESVEQLGEREGFRSFRKSVDERATWVLIDFVDVVVHVFEPNTRAYYDLETLWGDAPQISWQRDAKPARA